MSTHTPGPLELAVMDPNKDPVEFTRDSLSHGSGPVWMVWAPQHPKTRGVHPNPEHAVITATTGNGPASEANARLYAAAPDLLAALKDLEEACAYIRLVPCDGRSHGPDATEECEECSTATALSKRAEAARAIIAKAEGT